MEFLQYDHGHEFTQSYAYPVPTAQQEPVPNYFCEQAPLQSSQPPHYEENGHWSAELSSHWNGAYQQQQHSEVDYFQFGGASGEESMVANECAGSQQDPSFDWLALLQNDVATAADHQQNPYYDGVTATAYGTEGSTTDHVEGFYNDNLGHLPFTEALSDSSFFPVADASSHSPDSEPVETRFPSFDFVPLPPSAAITSDGTESVSDFGNSLEDSLTSLLSVVSSAVPSSCIAEQPFDWSPYTSSTTVPTRAVDGDLDADLMSSPTHSSCASPMSGASPASSPVPFYNQNPSPGNSPSASPANSPRKDTASNNASEKPRKRARDNNVSSPSSPSASPSTTRPRSNSDPSPPQSPQKKGTQQQKKKWTFVLHHEEEWMGSSYRGLDKPSFDSDSAEAMEQKLQSVLRSRALLEQFMQGKNMGSTSSEDKPEDSLRSLAKQLSPPCIAPSPAAATPAPDSPTPTASNTASGQLDPALALGSGLQFLRRPKATSPAATPAKATTGSNNRRNKAAGGDSKSLKRKRN
ncbi:hypothetical protein QOT17_012670 [Balamuthia mandrillaris]